MENKISPENFFINENFYPSIEDYFDYNVDEEVEELEDDWEIKVQLSKEESIFQIEKKWLINQIIQATDKWEERFPEESDSIFKQIEIALEKGININTINEELPKLFYPNGEYVIITKQDVIDYYGKQNLSTMPRGGKKDNQR